MSDKDNTPYEAELSSTGNEPARGSTHAQGAASPATFEITDTLGVGNRLGVGMSLGSAQQLPANTLQVYNGVLQVVQSDVSIDGKLTFYRNKLSLSYPSLSASTDQAKQKQLQLQGGLRVSDSLQIDQQVGIGVSATNTTRLLIQAQDTQTGLQTWQNSAGVCVAMIDAGGKVGIGTMTPAARLNVQGLFANKVGAVQLKAHSAIVAPVAGTSFDTLHNNDWVSFTGLPSQAPQAFTITKNNDGTLTLTPVLDLSADQKTDMYTDETLFQVANGNQQARLTVNSSGNVIIAGSLTVQGALSGNVTVPPGGQFIVQGTLDATGATAVRLPTGKVVGLTAADVGALPATVQGVLSGNVTVPPGGQFIVQGTLDATGATAVRLPTGKVVGLTAADVGALPANVSIDTAHLASNAVTSEKIADGQITKAKLAADVPIGGGVPGSNSITTAMLQDGAVKKQKIDFTGMTANDVKAVPIEGKVDRWWTMTANFAGPISQFQNTADGTAGLGMRTIVGKTLPDELARAAIAGISTKSGVSGVWGEAPDDAYALYAAGQAFITKDLTVDGTITGKLNPGHIVDQFINGSECVLSKGDIVKLKGGTVRKFQDSKGDIPIAEVVPADTYNDSAIIGIVDSKVMSNDASYLDDIVPGERLYVVIMGTFAQCKVDATHSPIAAGDLLTSSVRPGYATKATTPQIGRIIGKALEPLEGREGRISVFVNIL